RAAEHHSHAARTVIGRALDPASWRARIGAKRPGCSVPLPGVSQDCPRAVESTEEHHDATLTVIRHEGIGPGLGPRDHAIRPGGAVPFPGVTQEGATESAEADDHA